MHATSKPYAPRQLADVLSPSVNFLGALLVHLLREPFCFTSRSYLFTWLYE